MPSVLEQFRLDGRVAMITGGARGLGLAMAKALVSAGASVAITSRKAAKVASVAKEMGKGTLGVGLDVRSPGEIQSAIAKTVETFGGLDILVNNAGTTERGPVDDLSPDQWDTVLDTNLKGVWSCCQAALPALRNRGGGRVINVSSIYSEVGGPDRSPYVASKGGLTAMTRGLALELAPDGITVNAILPGPFQTEMHDEAARADLLERIPLRRWGTPDELGPLVVYLASKASDFMTGSALTIDGGYTAR